MLKGNAQDALSRRAAIGICNQCGTDEAMIDFALSNTKNKSQFCIEIAFLLKIIEMRNNECKQLRKERGEDVDY